MNQSRPVGLRERKREATRTRIAGEAARLATERGVAGVTADEIADAADISRATFFRFFATKETAIAEGFSGPKVDELLAVLAGQPASLSSLDAVAQTFRDVGGTAGRRDTRAGARAGPDRRGLPRPPGVDGLGLAPRRAARGGRAGRAARHGSRRSPAPGWSPRSRWPRCAPAWSAGSGPVAGVRPRPTSTKRYAASSDSRRPHEGIKGGAGASTDGRSVPPSTCSSLPVTQDDAGDAK